MQVSLVLAHPDRDSLNHAIARAVVDQCRRDGHTVAHHDLHAEGFEAILPREEISSEVGLPPWLAAHCEELARAEGIVIVHPNWWGQPPAILKGWIDRVLRPGVAYRFHEGDAGDGIPVGLLRARVAIVFNTSNTRRERELAVFGDPLDTLWRNCIFGLCGVQRFHRRTYGPVVTSTPEQRRGWLDQVREDVSRQLCPDRPA